MRLSLHTGECDDCAAPSKTEPKEDTRLCAEVSENHRQAFPMHQAQARTVLVVEDEVLIRMMTADALRDAGLRVIEARTADEALQHLRSGNSVHFVFTDIEM